MNKQRIWLFRGVAVTIPFLFFLLLEMGLRLSGFGRDLPLFILNQTSPDYLLPNPDVVKRYFPAGAATPNVSMEANFLLKVKPDNAIRIIVQGGSTAAGFPYGLGASLAGLLDHRIKDSLPEQSVEVVNTAMSAVNSYTLLDFADEIIEQQPDAVLIYAGHNEFLGILGVGSNYSAYGSGTTNLLFLKFKSLRTFQLLQGLYTKTQGNGASAADAPTPGENARTLMAQVAKHKDIALGSHLFEQGIAQFETNMSLLLAKYQNAGIPVFISTIASNLKDQSPFASADASPDLLRQLQALRNKAKLQQLSHQALTEFSDTVLRTSDSADLHFELGHIFVSVNNTTKALDHFIKAKDLDRLRFRAPEQINQLIRQLANKYQATLVDSHQAMQDRSPQGLIGNNLMLEHLHPNLQGYFVIANAFYDAIEQQNMFDNWQSIHVTHAWKNRPILPAEEYYGFAKILNLKTDYPFTDTPKKLQLPPPSDWQQQIGYDYFSKKLDWLSMVKASRQGYLQANDKHMLLKIDRLLADALPHSARANFNAGNSLFANNQKALAEHYFQRALRAADVTETMRTRIATLTHK